MGVERESHHINHREASSEEKKEETTLVFTYGTLKKGFSNHKLMQDLIITGDATYKGLYKTQKPYPLVCGPYRVPFLLNLPDAAGSLPVIGELYAVSRRGLSRLDELEGITKGHYERLPIEVEAIDGEGSLTEEETVVAYYGHRSYAVEMWKRNGKRGYGVYGEKESKGYVKRVDRPCDVTFLEQIQAFLVSSEVTN